MWTLLNSTSPTTAAFEEKQLPEGSEKMNTTTLQPAKTDVRQSSGAVLGIPRALGAVRGRISGKKPIRATMAYFTSASGAANTAFSLVAQLQPNQSPDFSSWGSVFDEMRVLGATLHWRTQYTTSPTALPATGPNIAIRYEPAYTGVALTSVHQALESEHAMLASTSFNGGHGFSPAPTTRSGFYVLRVRCPTAGVSGPDLSLASTTLSTGVWRPVLDANNYYWGAFNGYCAAGGTSAIIQFQAFVVMDVEFRSRR